MALGKERVRRSHRLYLWKLGLDFVLSTEWEADELLPPLEMRLDQIEGELGNFHQNSIVKLFGEHLSRKG